MLGPITHMFRLARAGRVIARHKVIPEDHLEEMPGPARLAYKIGGLGGAPETGGNPLASALTELGPTYIKLGQVLSLREDILPASITEELKNLLDRLPIVPFPRYLELLEEGLGRPVFSMFAWVDRRPVGSASIAQTHKATTVEGEPVIAAG